VTDSEDARTVRELRRFESRLQGRIDSMEKFGYPLWEVNAVKDAKSGVRAMAASVEAKDGSRFHGNWKETDQFLMRSNLPAMDKDREALDRIAAHWEVEREKEEHEEEDRPKKRGEFHRVDTYRKEDGARVRAHLARNPRRRR
jgi:hypothetical protein